MKMRNLFVTVILIVCCLTFTICEPFSHGHESQSINGGSMGHPSLSNPDLDNSDTLDSIDKRTERYAFGLGRRAYTYTSGGSGVKRLPVYNFGLGKRARPYSFGLGKRADFDNEYQEFENANDDGSYGVQQPQYDNNYKRNRPYSFGLGKRETYDDNMERRSAAQRYNFGLGRR